MKDYRKAAFFITFFLAILTGVKHSNAAETSVLPSSPKVNCILDFLRTGYFGERKSFALTPPDKLAVINPELTKEEMKAVDTYAGPGNQLNMELRGTWPSSLSKIQKWQIMNGLDSAINRSPGLREEAIVYRGEDRVIPVNTYSLKGMSLKKRWFFPRVGEVVTYDTYVSTSASEEVARNYSGYDGIIYRIHLKPGQKGLYFPSLKGIKRETEAELLLPRNTKFKVLSKRTERVWFGLRVYKKIVYEDVEVVNR